MFQIKKKNFSKFDKPLKDKKTVYEQPVWVIGRNKQYLVENTVSVVKVRSRKQKGFQYLLVITDILQSLLWQWLQRTGKHLQFLVSSLKLFLNLGPPTKLHSDQWKCFKAEIIMELCKHMRLKRQDQRIIIQKVTVWRKEWMN